MYTPILQKHHEIYIRHIVEQLPANHMISGHMSYVEVLVLGQDTEPQVAPGVSSQLHSSSATDV